MAAIAREAGSPISQEMSDGSRLRHGVRLIGTNGLHRAREWAELQRLGWQHYEKVPGPRSGDRERPDDGHLAIEDRALHGEPGERTGDGSVLIGQL